MGEGARIPEYRILKPLLLVAWSVDQRRYSWFVFDVKFSWDEWFPLRATSNGLWPEEPATQQSNKPLGVLLFSWAPERKCYYFQSYDSKVIDNFLTSFVCVCWANITGTQVSNIVIAGGDKQYGAVRMCFIVPEACRIWAWQRHYVAKYQRNYLLYVWSDWSVLLKELAHVHADHSFHQHWATRIPHACLLTTAYEVQH